MSRDKGHCCCLDKWKAEQRGVVAVGSLCVFHVLGPITVTCRALDTNVKIPAFCSILHCLLCYFYLLLFFLINVADRIVFWFLNKNLFQHFFSPNSVFFSLPTPFSFLYFSQCLLLFFSFTLVSLIALLTTRIGLTKRHFFSLLFPPLIFVIVCPAQYYLVGLLAVWSRQAWLLIGIAA